MILRRVTEHVKAQNWFAVALDFVIVVLGVFIGIQVSNWNGARQNDRLTDGYLSRLETDLELEGALWEKTRDYFGTARRYARAALDDYQKPAADLNGQFLVRLYQASQVWYVQPNRATFDELQTTGRIVLLKDDRLRTALANHYVRVDAMIFTFRQTSQYRRIARLYMHQAAQKQIRERCGDKWFTDERNFYYVALPESCDIDIPDELLRAEISRLRGNKEIERELRFHLSVLDAQLGTLGNTTDTAAVTLQTIRDARR